MYNLHYDYDDDCESLEKTAHTDLKMYVIADKYNMHFLEEQAFDEFKKSVERWTIQSIKSAQEKVVEIITTAYESSASDICRVIVGRLAELDIHKHHRDVPKLLELNLTIAEFGVDLIKSLGQPKSQSANIQDCPQLAFHCICGVSFRSSKIPSPLSQGASNSSYACPCCSLKLPASVWYQRII